LERGDKSIYRAPNISDVEPEVYDVSILYDVFFTFQTQLAMLATGRNAPATNQVLEPRRFRAYEAAFDVRVNFPRSSLRNRASLNGPGSAFILARGQEAY
jgi:hypothetical protein